NDPNLPALALLMAPLGALPLVPAYAAMLTLAVAALVWAAGLLGPLASPGQRLRLLPFALLAPTSLVALAQGQTTPFVLLAIAASLRAPAFWSGILLGLTLFRPQLFPLFALLALQAIAICAFSVALGSSDHIARTVRASIWSVLAAPHALVHDGVVPYPAVAAQATTTLRTWLWVASGVAVGDLQGAGIPIAAP